MNQFIHKGEDKKQFVRKMFDEISGTYDFLNKLLSLGVDARWRKQFISQINIKNNYKPRLYRIKVFFSGAYKIS